MAAKDTPPIDQTVAEHFAEQRDFIVETNATLREELIAELDDGLASVRAELRLGFKAVEARLGNRIRRLSRETNARFDRLERKLDAVIAPPGPRSSPE